LTVTKHSTITIPTEHNKSHKILTSSTVNEINYKKCKVRRDVKI